jgi:alpha-acetolactate decarboxylase
MLQSLKTFSALCLGLVMQAALGQPTNFQHFGNFQRMMHSGDTAGQVALSKLDQSPGRWGVGALAGLKGEIIQVDGKLLVSLGTGTTGKVEAPKAGAEAVLWASDSVTQWKEISVPGDMSQAQFEKFVSDQAAAIGLDLNQPCVFRVTGGYSHLIWHVLTGEKPKSGGTGHDGHGYGGHGGGHANKQSGMKLFRNPTATGQLVAVYSGKKLEGVVSHQGERFHFHYIDDSQTVSGHVDQYNVRSGATLWLPVR